MVLRQLLLPKEGGGSLRRFLALRKRLFLDQWNDARPLRGPVPLLDIRRPDDSADLRESLNPTSLSWPFKGWRGSDDGVIGGFSKSQMEYIEGSSIGDDDGGGGGGYNGDAASSSLSSSSSPPFLRWSGTLNTQINAQSSKSHSVTRSGFAAILSPEFPGSVPLGSKYKALEICCRPDDRTYAVNLHVETYFPEDVYQGFIVGGGSSSSSSSTGGNYSSGDSRRQYDYNDPRSSSYDMNDDSHHTSIDDAFAALSNDDVRGQDPSLDVRQYLKQRRELIRQTHMSSDDHPYHGHPPRGFQRYILPFRDFVLTSRGRMRQAQRGLDGAVCIESIGFTLMDGKDGDFTFDLVSLRAVNVMNGEVVGTLEDERLEEEFQDGLKPKLKIKKDEEQLQEEEPVSSAESGRVNEKRL